jgi:hypothetical protein
MPRCPRSSLACAKGGSWTAFWRPDYGPRFVFSHNRRRPHVQPDTMHEWGRLPGRPRACVKMWRAGRGEPNGRFCQRFQPPRLYSPWGAIQCPVAGQARAVCTVHCAQHCALCSSESPVLYSHHRQPAHWCSAAQKPGIKGLPGSPAASSWLPPAAPGSRGAAGAPHKSAPVR